MTDRPGLGAKAHWLAAPAADLVADQQVVQVDSEATVDEACDALIKHRIQSVPLYDARSQSYVGMFDVHDLAAYILARRGGSGSGSGGGSGAEAADGAPADRSGASSLMRQATAAGAQQQQQHQPPPPEVSGERVARLSDLSHANPFYSVVPETTVAQVAQVFAKGAHRVVVMQDERTIRGILSQAGVVRYFFERCGGEGSCAAGSAEARLLDASLAELGLVTRDVVCVTPDTPVIRALSLFERWRISSLALVDDERRLIGNLSLADVKALVRDRRLVAATCMELVQATRYAQGASDGQDRAAVFSVRPQATLRHVLAKLIATGAHRVWISEPPPGPAADAAAAAAAAAVTSAAPPMNRRASVSSISSQSVSIAPPHFASAFGDVVCGIVSLTDVLRLLIDTCSSSNSGSSTR